MRAVALLVGVVLSLLLCFLPLMLSGGAWKAAEEKARARRIADAKMNARLLSLKR